MTEAVLLQFNMIENEPTLAEGIVRDLELKELGPHVLFIENEDELLDAISVDINIKVFWVDIHHGVGKETIGIEWIKYIKKQCPSSFVVVYTGHPQWRKKCLEAGADLFYAKGGQYESKIREIRGRIIDFIKLKSQRFNLKEYYASVVNVGEELVKLECYIEDAIIDGFVPIDMLINEHYNGPRVNDIIKVSVIKNGNSIKYVFDPVAEVPPHIRSIIEWEAKEEDNEQDEDDSMDSVFWTNTKE